MAYINRLYLIYLLIREYYISKAKPNKDNKQPYYNTVYMLSKNYVSHLRRLWHLPNAAGLRAFYTRLHVYKKYYLWPFFNSLLRACKVKNKEYLLEDVFLGINFSELRITNQFFIGAISLNSLLWAFKKFLTTTLWLSKSLLSAIFEVL